MLFRKLHFSLNAAKLPNVLIRRWLPRSCLVSVYESTMKVNNCLQNCCFFWGILQNVSIWFENYARQSSRKWPNHIKTKPLWRPLRQTISGVLLPGLPRLTWESRHLLPVRIRKLTAIHILHFVFYYTAEILKTRGIKWYWL